MLKQGVFPLTFISDSVTMLNRKYDKIEERAKEYKSKAAKKSKKTKPKKENPIK